MAVILHRDHTFVDNGDYKINSDDRVIQGQARPKVILSLNNFPI